MNRAGEGRRAKVSAGAGSGRAAGRTGAGFLPVRVVRGAKEVVDRPAVEAEILLPGGRRVRIAGHLSVGQLAELLDAVEGGARC